MSDTENIFSKQALDMNIDQLHTEKLVTKKISITGLHFS
ncbi:hypothetical protein D088_780012 [Salmonella enterica subsp. houtenae serovar 16:z4,z32:-- str. RKS3027]|nr:hypothetical protein D088_780012 [Salmonella enterica subsp. houtenae serovar 16:z4,z32:-- str. RKS3027]